MDDDIIERSAEASAALPAECAFVVAQKQTPAAHFKIMSACATHYNITKINSFITIIFNLENKEL